MASIDVDGLTFITSSKRTVLENPGGIATSFPGNHTAKNLDFTDASTTVADIRAFWMVTVQSE